MARPTLRSALEARAEAELCAKAKEAETEPQTEKELVTA